MLFNGIFWFQKLVRIPVLFFTFSIHEFFHSFTAYSLGDVTQKSEGRLTLNPLKHIDWMGFICLMIWNFGWAKPVSVNPSYFGNSKSGKRSRIKTGMALTALAGPMSNFFFAFIALMIYFPLARIYISGVYPGNLYFTQIMNSTGVPFAIRLILLLLYEAIQLNLSLGVFNLLPVPPLDGSKIFSVFLPDSMYFRFINGGRYPMATTVVLLVLLYLGVISAVIYPVILFLYKFYYLIANMIFSFL